MIGHGPDHDPGSSDPEPDHDPGTLPAPSWDWQTPPITAPGPVLRLADTADAWTRWDLSDAICSMQAASMQSAACRLHHAISLASREMWKAYYPIFKVHLFDRDRKLPPKTFAAEIAGRTLKSESQVAAVRTRVDRIHCSDKNQVMAQSSSTHVVHVRLYMYSGLYVPVQYTSVDH